MSQRRRRVRLMVPRLEQFAKRVQRDRVGNMVRVGSVRPELGLMLAVMAEGKENPAGMPAEALIVPAESAIVGAGGVAVDQPAAADDAGAFVFLGPVLGEAREGFGHPRPF